MRVALQSGEIMRPASLKNKLPMSDAGFHISRARRTYPSISVHILLAKQFSPKCGDLGLAIPCDLEILIPSIG